MCIDSNWGWAKSTVTKLESLNKPLRMALKNCLLPLNESWSLPPTVYTDKCIAKLESEKIFRQQWVCFGRSEQLTSVGDYRCFDFANQSVILLRDKDRKIRAFANTCRHRSARLLNGSGNTMGIKCPFHSWAYKLDGSLAAAPHMQAANNFYKSDFNLFSYHVAEHVGFVFVCLAAQPPDFNSTLGDFATIHAPWPIEKLASKRQRIFEVDCNWKTFIEVFNEYYHLPFVHPNSVNDVYNTPDPSDKVSGAYATQFGSTEGTGGLLQTSQQRLLPAMPGLVGKEAAGVRYSWLFPNMTFAVGIDAMWVYVVFPIEVDRCVIHQTACFPKETIQHNDFQDYVQAYYYRLDTAIEEDIPALLNQQKGLANPESQPGRFQPLLESNLAYFANWYAKRMLA